MLNARDRVVINACSWLLKLATDKTQAQVLVALYRAQGRLVPEDMLRRADFPKEQYP